MKRLLLVALLLCVSAYGQMWPMPGPGSPTVAAPPAGGFSVVHEYAVSSTGTSSAINVPITGTTAGNALIVVLQSNNNYDYTITGTPTQWYKVKPTSGVSIQVLYSLNIAGGTTSLSLTPSAYDIVTGKIIEVSGLATSNAADVYAPPIRNTYGTGNATAFTGAVTTTNANDVIFGIGAFNVSALTYTAGTGYTLLSTVTNGNYTVAVEYKTVSSTGTYNPGLTFSAANYVNTSTAAFKLQ